MKCMREIKSKALFLLAVFICNGCGTPNATEINDSYPENLFEEKQTPLDGGTSFPEETLMDAGIPQEESQDAGTAANHEDPSVSDYPDTPDTAACALLYPEDESVISDTTPFFIWESALGAEEYKFELAADLNFAQLIFVSQLLDEPLTERTFTLPDEYALTPNTVYYWRVHSVINNQSQLCTTHFSFQIQ